jgi:amino acid transporter/nucleotide-binding universal stress UspA family protein
MMTIEPPTVPAKTPAASLPRVMVATTAMLSFISFWRAAAIVLNDLASSAYYAPEYAQGQIGRAAPWFILAIMLFAYAVRAIYIESCSMFVRGGVYRVVKEAMGGTMAKFSVSALMFDYILTGPISGVSAGQYLVGFLNNLLQYAHTKLILPINSTSAVFACLVTLYFWRENIKGIPESSHKALRIMQVTTIMVALLILWCGYTVVVRGAHLPPWPLPSNLHFARAVPGVIPDALGWLRGTGLETIGLIGIFVALGHSVLAMSGEESLAQVYREIEHPKLKNLEKAGFVIFLYSLLFTGLVAFFVVMIIPDQKLGEYTGNYIGGLAMSVVGPYTLRLLFRAFVVVVGVLILAGAVNTAIVGSNGVLNRVSEDGVLTAWFRHPHPRFGTSHRIINMVVGLQLLTIILSRGNVYYLGEAYAFGVIWSFVMKGLAVMVLRYTEPEQEREFRVPLNPKIGGVEVPLGLALITITLFGMALANLVTKQIATVSGIAFSLVLYAIFTASEKMTHPSGAAHKELDQFNLEPAEDLSPQTVGVRPGNVVVMVRDYNTLYNLALVLTRVNPEEQDVVVLHIRILQRAGSGEHALAPEQLFTSNEQELFTKALALAEKNGKTVHLAVVAANEIWDGILRAAQNLQASAVVLGRSEKMPAAEEARRAGEAWERLPEPRPQLTLEIYSPSGQEEIFYLGPHAPRLSAKEIDLLHSIWLRFSKELRPEELHHHDIVHFALTELEHEIAEGKEQEIRDRLKQHLEEIKARRVPHL